MGQVRAQAMTMGGVFYYRGLDEKKRSRQENIPLSSGAILGDISGMGSSAGTPNTFIEGNRLKRPIANGDQNIPGMNDANEVKRESRE